MIAALEAAAGLITTAEAWAIVGPLRPRPALAATAAARAERPLSVAIVATPKGSRRSRAILTSAECRPVRARLRVSAEAACTVALASEVAPLARRRCTVLSTSDAAAIVALVALSMLARQESRSAGRG